MYRTSHLYIDKQQGTIRLAGSVSSCIPAIEVINVNQSMSCVLWTNAIARTLCNKIRHQDAHLRRVIIP